MYRNLEAEMKRAAVDRYQLAKCIGRTYNTILQKINGNYPFTLDEALKIHQEFFSNVDFFMLFSTEETKTENGRGA